MEVELVGEKTGNVGMKFSSLSRIASMTSTSKNWNRKDYTKMPRRNFRELEAKMSPDRIAASNIRVKKMVEEMPLNKLRAARKLTQKHLAKVLHRDQSAISQMERRTDMYVSTLADFIKAMGGELEILANFPDGTIRISGIADTALESQ